MTARLVRAGAALVIAIPLVVLALAAVSVRWFYPQVIPHEWSGQSWDLLTATGTVDAAATGILVASIVTVIAISLAWPAARVIARTAPRWRALALLVLLLPSVIPPVGLAMGIDVGLLNLGADGTVGAVVAAHLVPALPYTVVVLVAAFARHDDRIDQQASTLGASPLQVLAHVTVPAMRPGLAAAAVLTFVVSWSQYLLTLLAGSGRVVTLTMLLFNAISGGNPTTIATLALAAIIPVAILISLVAAPLTTAEDHR